MSALIRKPKDFAAGLLYVALGVAAVVLAQDYDMGRAGRMGPGYFPTAIGACLTLLGGVSILRSLMSAGETVSAVSWRPLLLITASVFLFAYLLPRLGVVLALVVLLLVAVSANRNARFSLLGMAAAVLLVGACTLVFVNALGLPLPVVGRWIGG